MRKQKKQNERWEKKRRRQEQFSFLKNKVFSHLPRLKFYYVNPDFLTDGMKSAVAEYVFSVEFPPVCPLCPLPPSLGLSWADFVSTNEAARQFGVDGEDVLQWTYLGLPHMRFLKDSVFPRSRRVRLADVAMWLEELRTYYCREEPSGDERGVLP